MLPSSHAWNRLVKLYRLVLCRSRTANAQQFSYPPELRHRCAQVLVEQLEQRMFLSGELAGSPLPEQEGLQTPAISMPIAPSAPQVFSTSVSGKTGDVIPVDLTEVAISENYRLVGARLVDQDWLLTLQPHGANYYLMHQGAILGTLVTPISLGGGGLGSTGRLYVAPSLSNGLPGDQRSPDKGFQGTLRLSFEAGPEANPVLIDVDVAISAGASGTGATAPLGSGESAVLRAQQRLSYYATELGITPLNLTGSLDQPTQSAMRTFQTQAGLPATGAIDEQTAAYLAAFPSDPAALSTELLAMLEQAAGGLQTLGESISNLESIQALLPLVGGGQTVDENGVPKSEEVSLDAVFHFADLVHDYLVAPLNEFHSSATQASLEGLAGFLTSQGVQVTAQQVSPGHIQLSFRLQDMIHPTYTMVLDSAISEVCPQGGVEFDLGVMAQYALQVTLDVDMSKGALASQAVSLRVDEFSAGFNGWVGDLAGTIPLGFVDGTIDVGNYENPASAQIEAQVSVTAGLGESTSLGDLNSAWLSGALTFTPSGSVNVNLPLSLNIPGLAGIDAGLVVSGPLFSAPGPQLQVRWNGVLNGEGLIPDEFRQFVRVSADQVVAMLRELAGSLTDLSQMPAFRVPLPFVAGHTLGDYLNFGDVMIQRVISTLESEPNVPNFRTAGELTAAVPFLSNLRYQADFLLGGQNVPVFLWDFSLFESLAPELVNLDLGSLSAGVLGALNSDGGVNLLAQLDMGFTMGIDLRPLGQTIVQGAVELDADGDGQLDAVTLELVFGDRWNQAVPAADGKTDLELTLLDGTKVTVDFDGLRAGSTVQQVLDRINAAIVAVSAENRLECLFNTPTGQIVLRDSSVSVADEDPKFRAVCVNGSLGGMLLGIVGAASPSEDSGWGDAVIYGKALHNDSMANHLFLEDVRLRASVELTGTFIGTGRLGLLSLNLGTEADPNVISAGTWFDLPLRAPWDAAEEAPSTIITLHDLHQQVLVWGKDEGQLADMGYGDPNAVAHMFDDLDINASAQLHLPASLTSTIPGMEGGLVSAGIWVDWERVLNDDWGLNIDETNILSPTEPANGELRVRLDGFDEVGPLIEAGYDDLVGMLNELLTVVQDRIRNFDIMEMKIPGLNRSLNELLDLAQSMSQRIAQAVEEADPSAALNELLAQLGLQLEGIEDVDGEDVARFAFTHVASLLNSRLPLNVNLSSGQTAMPLATGGMGLAGGQTGVPLAVTGTGLAADSGLGIDTLAGIGGDYNVDVAGGLTFNLKLGFSENLGLVIFNDSTITGSLGVAATELLFESMVGPFGVRVGHGTATDSFILDADGQVGGALAGFALGMDSAQRCYALGNLTQDSFVSTIQGLGRLHLPIDRLSGSNWVPFDADNPNLEIDIDLAGILDPNIQLLNVIAAPSEASLNNLLAGLDFSSWQNFDASDLFAALDTVLGTLEIVLDDSIVNADIPLLGADLVDISDFVSRLRTVLSSPAGTAAELQMLLYNTLGPGEGDAAGWLLDANGDGIVTIDDVAVEADNGHLQFGLSLGATQQAVFVDNKLLSLGVDSLGLDLTGSVIGSVSFGFDLTFGVSKQLGVYFDVGGEEDFFLDFSADVDVQGQGSLGLLSLDVTSRNTDTRSPQDKIDAFVDDQGHGVDFTGRLNKLSGRFSVDLTDAQVALGAPDGKLTLSEISAASDIGDIVVVDVNLSAALHLELVAGIAHSDQFPSIRSDLYLLWLYGPDTGYELTTPVVQFTDVGLDMGKFVGNILRETIETINTVLEPVEPIISFLTAPIPVISDLGTPVTLLDLASLFGYGDYADFIYAVDTIADLADYLAGVSSRLGAAGLVLPFGSFTYGGHGPDAPVGGGADDGYQGILDNSIKRFLWGPAGGQGATAQQIAQAIQSAGDLNDAALSELLARSAGIGDSSGTGFDDESGFSFPILNNPLQVFELLLGREDIDLVRYDLPRLGAEFTYSQAFTIIGPLMARITGTAGAAIDFAFGFDTQGFFDMARSGKAQELFNGLYLADWDTSGKEVREVELYGSLGASAELNVGIARGGAGGGVYFGFYLDLNDPNNDGKVRLGELYRQFQAGPEYIFDFGGIVQAYLNAYVKVGWGPFSWEKNWEFARVTLVEFEYGAPDFSQVDAQVDPVLAGFATDGGYEGVPVQDGRLVVNVGEFALHRYVEQGAGTIDGNDMVRIERGHGPDEVFVSWSGYRQLYTGVSSVWVESGQGDDTIEIDDGILMPVTIDGGAGNDRIVTSRGTAIVHGGTGDDTIIIGDAEGNAAYGDEDNDTIIGGSGNETIYGGAGNDRLEGRLGDDRIFGEAGDDYIDGGMGDDYLVGGADADTIFGQVGSDTIYGDFDASGGEGDEGADRIDGGSENDVIYAGGGGDNVSGGRGNDTILGGTGDDLLQGDSGNDTIHGQVGDDTLYGGAGSDELYGNEDDDTLIAGASANVGSDLYAGDAGTMHTLDGGAGSDWIYGDLGVDVVLGGEGNNFIKTFAGDDTIAAGSGNDTIDSGAGDDIITVAGGNNRILGGAGSETVHTGTGNDYIDVRGPSAELGSTHLIVSTGGNNTIFTDAGTDLITTGAGSDTISAGNGHNTVHSGGGDDVITAGDGSNEIYASAAGAVDRDVVTLGRGLAIVDTGAGDDTVAAGGSGDTTDKTVATGSGDDVVTLNVAGGDHFIDMGVGDDRVQSSGGNNTVMLGAGNDQASTGAGNDWIVGSTGDDTIQSGGGNDVLWGGEAIFATTDLDLANPAKFTFPTRFADAQGDPATRVDGLVLPSITPTVAGGASVPGGLDGNDVIDAGAGDDIVFGGGMADRIVGGAGNDYVDGGAGEDTVWGGEGLDVILGGANSDVLYGGEGIDNLYGNEGDDVLMGDAGGPGQRLYGGAGDDSIYAYADSSQGAGDQLWGDEGNDWIYGNIAGEVMFGGSGNDNLLGDYLSGAGYGENPDAATTGGNDKLFGDGGGDVLNGMAGDDELWGGSDSDLLDGQGGTDWMYGGEGIDVILLDTDLTHAAPTQEVSNGHGGNRFLGDAADDFATDILRADGTAGDDTMLFRENTPGILTLSLQVNGGAVRTFTAAWRDAAGVPLVEQFQLNGLDGDDELGFVSSGASAVDFSALNDRSRDWVGVINGGSGDDILYGTTGRDRLNGETGADTIYGYDGDDRLWGDMQTVDDLTSGSEPDRLYSGAGNDDLIGGHRPNELFAWSFDPRTGGQFGVYIDPATGERYETDGNGQYVLESTGLNRVLGRNFDDKLYGGTGLDFLYGGEGDDVLYDRAGNPFDGGLDGGDDAWKEYARQTDRVWYYSGTAADDRIEVNYVTEPGLLTQHHLITRLTNNNGNYTFDAQVRLDFLAKDDQGNFIWDPTDMLVDMVRLQSLDPDERALAYTELVLTGSLLPSEGDFDAIIIDALGGNDDVYVGPTVRKTVWIDAGEGDDVVEIASGNAILPDRTEDRQRNDIYAQPANAVHAFALEGTTAVCLGENGPLTEDMFGSRFSVSVNRGVGRTLEVTHVQNGPDTLLGAIQREIQEAGLADQIEAVLVGNKVILRVVDPAQGQALSLAANLPAFSSMDISSLPLSGQVLGMADLRRLDPSDLSAETSQAVIGHSIRWTNLTIDSPDDVDWYTMDLLAVDPTTTLSVQGASELDDLQLTLFQYVDGVLAQIAASGSGQIALADVAGLDVRKSLYVQVRQSQPLPTIYQLEIQLRAGDDFFVRNCASSLATDLDDQQHQRRDIIIGGLGNDVLRGGIAEDWIIGGSGNDVLSGGQDRQASDLLLGGEDDDLFQMIPDDLPTISGTDQEYLTTMSDWIEGGSGQDGILILGGDLDSAGNAVPDHFAIRYNRVLARYELMSLVWDTANQRFIVDDGVSITLTLAAGRACDLANVVEGASLTLRLTPPHGVATSHVITISGLSGDINAGDVATSLQTQLQALGLGALLQAGVINDTQLTLSTLQRGYSLEVLATGGADLGFDPGQSASGTTSVYREQYAYWQAVEVEHTLIQTRSGDDEVRADPEYRVVLPDGSGYRSSEYGIARGVYQEGAVLGSLEIYGGPGNDRLYGGALDDLIDGGEGNDFVAGGLGDDALYGGGGSDLIYGNTGQAPDRLEFALRGQETGSNDTAGFATLVGDITDAGAIGGLSLHSGDRQDWLAIQAPQAQWRLGSADLSPLSLEWLEQVRFADSWSQTFFDGDLFVSGQSLWAGSATLGMANVRLYAARQDSIGGLLQLLPVEEFAGTPDYYILRVINPGSFGFVGDQELGTISNGDTLSFRLRIDGSLSSVIEAPIDLGNVPGASYGNSSIVRILNQALESQGLFSRTFFYLTPGGRYALSLRQAGDISIEFDAGNKAAAMGFASGQNNASMAGALGEYTVQFAQGLGTQTEISGTDADVALHNDNLDYANFLAPAGDLNHDGVMDYIVGVHDVTADDSGVDLDGVSEGVSPHEAAGSSYARVQLGGTQSYITLVLPAPVAGNSYGVQSRISTADLNHDGFADLVVGVTQADGESYWAAGVYVCLGQSGVSGGATIDVLRKSSFVLSGMELGEEILEVRSVGDVTGDQNAVDDLVIVTHDVDDLTQVRILAGESMAFRDELAGWTFDSSDQSWSTSAVSGATNLWHRTSARLQYAGDRAWYFGAGEGLNGGGTYDGVGRAGGYLTSPVIDVTQNISNVTLEFSYWLDTYRASTFLNSWSYDLTTVEINYGDGLGWRQVVRGNEYLMGESDDQPWWHRLRVSVGTLQTGDQFQVRFVFDTLNAFDNYHEGWYIDDVRLFADASIDQVEQTHYTIDEGFISSLSPVGQAYGDSTGDFALLVSQWGGAPITSDVTLYVISGKQAPASAYDLRTGYSNPAGTAFAIDAGGGTVQTGFELLPAGDIEGDGYNDILVNYWNRLTLIGASRVFSGGASSLTSAILPLLLTPLGDLDGDGTAELAYSGIETTSALGDTHELLAHQVMLVASGYSPAQWQGPLEGIVPSMLLESPVPYYADAAGYWQPHRVEWARSLGDLTGDGRSELALLDVYGGKYFVIQGRDLMAREQDQPSLAQRPHTYDMGTPLPEGYWTATAPDLWEDSSQSAAGLPRADGTAAGDGLSHSADVGDFNHDGFADTLVWNDAFTEAYLLYGPVAPVGGIWPISDLAHTLILLNGARPAGTSGDIDGDGIDDLLFVGTLYDGSSFYTGVQMIAGSPQVRPTLTVGGVETRIVVYGGLYPQLQVSVINWDRDADGRGDLLLSYGDLAGVKAAIITGLQIHNAGSSPVLVTSAALLVTANGAADWSESTTREYLNLGDDWTRYGGVNYVNTLSFAAAADLNADGRDELIFLLPQQWTFVQSVTGLRRTFGALYVIEHDRVADNPVSLGSPWSSSSDQPFAPVMVLEDWARVDQVTPAASTGQYSGLSVLGDVNCDGRQDIALVRAGSPTNDSMADILVFFTDNTWADGSLESEPLSGDQDADIRIHLPHDAALPSEGWREDEITLAVGDLDGNHQIDLAIGRPSQRIFSSSALLVNQSAAGRVQVLCDLGSLNGRNFTLSYVGGDLNGDGLADALGVTGQSAGDRLGANLSFVDLNGDRYGDLLLGAAGADVAAGDILVDAGKVYVLQGGPRGSTLPPEGTEVAVISNDTLDGVGQVVHNRLNGPVVLGGDGSAVLLEGQTEQWYRFRTIGDGSADNTLRTNQPLGMFGTFDLPVHTGSTQGRRQQLQRPDLLHHRRLRRLAVDSGRRSPQLH